MSNTSQDGTIATGKTRGISKTPKEGSRATGYSLSHQWEARRVRVTPRQEDQFLLQFLGVSHSAFNIVIFVKAVLGELFERKSLHLIIIREVLACRHLFIHGRTIFLLI